MKEAVVFIIDTSPSMNSPYPKPITDDSNASTSSTAPAAATTTNKTTTRLECAKQVVLSMISDLILKSKTNEVSVILCKTLETKHHKIASTTDYQEAGDDLPFPHLTELTPGIVRPTPALLRQITNIQSSIPSVGDDDDGDGDTSSSTIQHNGDLCDAIILATDAFYERGTKYKFQRKMILLTDAEHTLVMDVKSTLTIIDTLRDMDCMMEVFGFDFTSSATYQEPIAVASSMSGNAPDEVESNVPNKKIKLQKEQKEECNTNDMDQIVYSTKSDREQLLISLTEKTGGAVIAVSTLQEILQAQQGRRVQNSVLTKFEFRLAPKISFEARFFLLMSKQSFPKLITKAVKVTDDSKAPSTTTTETIVGEESVPETSYDVKRAELFVDPDDPDDIVEDEDRTKAIYFGSTLIPLSTFDYEGLKPTQMGARLEVLGFMHRSKIPLEYLSGPPSGISGHESPTACAAISALASALHRLDKVAIGTFYKRSTSTKPLLVTVFPYIDQESMLPETQPTQLAVLQIPFGGETKKIELDCFDAYIEIDDDGNAVESEKSKACDDLITSLMLPDDVLRSGHVPSPLIRSCNQTKIQRAIDPKSDIVSVRSNNNIDEVDPMITPPDILERALPALDSFESTFDFDKVIAKMNATPEKTKNQTTGRKVLTYKDFI